MQMLWFTLVLVATKLITTEGKAPELHRVGGTKGWTQNINYTDWALHENFYVGDWLYFGFDKHVYNVLQVNRTSYENCSDKGFIKNITRGGRDVFNLTEAKPYYFLSSGGYCFHGMKLAVIAVDFVPSPEPAPLIINNGAPTDTSSRIMLPILLAFTLIWGYILEYYDTVIQHYAEFFFRIIS